MELLKKYSVDECDMYIFKQIRWGKLREINIFIDYEKEIIVGGFYDKGNWCNISIKESKGILAAIPEEVRLRNYDNLVWN